MAGSNLIRRAQKYSAIHWPHGWKCFTLLLILLRFVSSNHTRSTSNKNLKNYFVKDYISSPHDNSLIRHFNRRVHSI